MRPAAALSLPREPSFKVSLRSVFESREAGEASGGSAGSDSTGRGPGRAAMQGREQFLGLSVVAEGPIDVNEEVAVAGSEDEGGTELKGITAELVLAETGGLRASSCFGIVPAKDMEQVR